MRQQQLMKYWNFFQKASQPTFLVSMTTHLSIPAQNEPEIGTVNTVCHAHDKTTRDNRLNLLCKCWLMTRRWLLQCVVKMRPMLHSRDVDAVV